MKTTTFQTNYPFAKAITIIDLLGTSDLEGIKEYIEPYLQQMLEETIIPDYLTLRAVITTELDYTGTHTWIFTINDVDTFDEDETLDTTIRECLQDIFPFDPDAGLEIPAIVQRANNYQVIAPFIC